MPEIYTLIDSFAAQTPIVLPHWRLRKVDGLGMPDVRHVSEQYAGQDGETYISSHLRPRIITLAFQLVHETEADLWDARAELLRIVSDFPTGFQLRVDAPNGDVRQMDLRYDNGLDLLRSLDMNDIQQIAALQCVAVDPLLYDPAPILETFDNTYINGTAPIDNLGTWPSFPQIQITGPLDSPRIYNATSDEELDLPLYNIAAGEVVFINLFPGQKTIVSSVNGNILGELTEASDLATFHLAVGPQGIQVSGTGATGATEFTFGYYARYIGM